MATNKTQPSARERLLAAANHLFYEEGVHTVGIDRVIAEAGVAKASLYSTFGSKEELVHAYLAGRAERRQARISERIARFDTPRERIFAIFDLLAEVVAEPKYRGCAFINASAEGPRDEGKVFRVCTDTRVWTRELFVKLSRDAGAREPERLGRQLALIYDGVLVRASMDRNAQAIDEARTLVELALQAGLPG